MNFNYNFIDINRVMKNKQVKEAIEELICIENFRLRLGQDKTFQKNKIINYIKETTNS